MSSASKDWGGKRVIVTGAAGLIGSALVWALNRHGCSDVIVVDFPASDERSANLSGLRYTEMIAPADLPAGLASGSLARPDCIFHLGACSSTTETDEAYLRQNN